MKKSKTNKAWKRAAAGALSVALVAGSVPANVGGFLTGGQGIVMSAAAEDVVSETPEVTEIVVTADNAEELLSNIVEDANFIISENVSVSAIKVTGANVVLKTENGATITTTDNTKRGIYLDEQATMTIIGGASSSKKLIIDMTGSKDSQATIDNESTLIVDKYAAINGTVAYFDGANVEVKTSGAVTTDRENAYAISGNNQYPGGNVKLAGTVTSTNGIAVYHPDSSSLTISGGTITGLTAVYARMSNITITGGTLKATGEQKEPGTVANGADPTGDALLLQSYAPPYGVPNVTISGGTLNSANGKAIACYAVADSQMPIVTITGGTFKNGSLAQDVSDYFDTDTYVQDDNGKIVEIATIAYEIVNNSTGKKTYGTSTTGQIQIGDETIKLWKNVTPVNIITSIWASTSEPSVLDLNGFNVTCTSTSRTGISPRTGNHIKVVNTGNNKDASITLGKYADITGNGTKLTIDKDVTINGEIAVFENATLNVYGTVKTTKASDYAISGNQLQSTGSTINIYDGAKVESTNGIGIYHPQNGTLNVEGGTISGKTAIYARTGNINISGGRFIADGEVKNASEIANGADPTGDALAIQSHPSYGVPVVRISGGNFSSEKGKSVATYTVSGSAMSDISITGGTFSDTLDTTFIAKDYKQVNGAVIKPELKDISKYVTLTLNKTSFSYNNEEFDSEPIITVAAGFELVEGRDYKIEGDQKATDVGTYVVKVKGIGNYKGEVTATWSITNQYAVNTYIDNALQSEKIYSFGQSATVTADVIDGMKFSHWEVGTGTDAKKVSTSATYSFIVKGVTDIRAIYVPVTQTVKEEAVLSLTTFKSNYNGKNAVGFDFTHSVPEGYTVKEVGLLYGTNKLVGANTGVTGYAKVNLLTNGSSVGVSDLENALKTRSTVKKYVANYKCNNGTVRFSYALGNTNNDAYANAVGYVTYVDDKNKTVTVYSDAVAACYNTAG